MAVSVCLVAIVYKSQLINFEKYCKQNISFKYNDSDFVQYLLNAYKTISRIWKNLLKAHLQNPLERNIWRQF